MVEPSATREGPRRSGAVDDATAETLVASRALVAVAARSLGAVEGEITLRQYRALVLLAARGDQNVGGLADALGIHASTATRLCDRLADKGFIVRTTSRESRRVVTVALSPKGRDLVRSVNLRRRNEIRKIVGRIDAAHQRRLT